MPNTNNIIQGLPFWSSIPEISLGKQIYDSLRKCTDDEVAYVSIYTYMYTYVCINALCVIKSDTFIECS